MPEQSPAAPLVLALVGPTAVGKTDVALALARVMPVDLISMDSVMVYRGLDIGTAKPPLETRAEFPHALVDVRDIGEPYSVADFVADADALVRRAWSRGRLPVLVGGTMLYLRGFRDGLAPLPEADAGLRAAIAREAADRGWPALHAELAAVDPEAAAGVHPNNPQRLQRALEVYRLTGRPISAFWAEQGDVAAAARLGARLVEVAIVPGSRADLHRRIAERFAGMLAAGLVDEVARLARRPDFDPGLPAFRAVGYRQVCDHLAGRITREDLPARGAAATRQLARRQLTWLRAWPWVTTFEMAPAPDLAEAIRARLGPTQPP